MSGNQQVIPNGTSLHVSFLVFRLAKCNIADAV